MRKNTKKLITRDAYYKEKLPGYHSGMAALDCRFGTEALQQAFHFDIIGKFEYSVYDGVSNKCTILFEDSRELDRCTAFAECRGITVGRPNLRNTFIQ